MGREERGGRKERDMRERDDRLKLMFLLLLLLRCIVAATATAGSCML